MTQITVVCCGIVSVWLIKLPCQNYISFSHLVMRYNRLAFLIILREFRCNVIMKCRGWMWVFSKTVVKQLCD